MNDTIPTEIAFTDGAVIGNPGPGGWAFWMGNLKMAEPLMWTTNNLAELMAIYKVFEHAEPGTHLTIITDSKLAIGWLTRRFQRNQPHIDDFVRFMWDVIAFKGLTVTYELVKGHSQNLGNNVVDLMARKQAEIAAYFRAVSGV